MMAIIFESDNKFSITLRVSAVVQGVLDKLPACLTENAIQHHKRELKPHPTYALEYDITIQ